MSQWVQYRDRIGRVEGWDSLALSVRWLDADPDTAFAHVQPERFLSSKMVILAEEPRLTARQAASYLGCVRQRIYQLHAAGAFGPYRVPCLFKPSELDAYLLRIKEKAA